MKTITAQEIMEIKFMGLKEFKEKIDAMYEKYGDVNVCIDLTLDDNIDKTVYRDEKSGNVYTEVVGDITELKDNWGEEVTGICISNYVMEDNNWGKGD